MEFWNRVSFEPVFGWYVVIPLVLIALASLWLTITSTGISRGGRTVLLLLRLSALAILLLGWIQPGFISERTRETAGAVAVLMDQSESMTLPSESRAKSRWDVQQEVWNTIESSTNLALGETKIVPYFYGQKLGSAAPDDLPSLSGTFSQPPNGRLTDIGQALAEITKLQIDPPLRAVVICGDMTQTVLPANVDASLISRQMAQLDQPVHVVGIGSRGEQAGLRDVAIEGLPEHYSAFVKKELNVRFVVKSKGMQNQPVRLQLKLRASGKADQILASSEILAARNNQLTPQEFNIKVPEEGEYLLEASAVPIDGEDQIESNNTAISFISVREGGAKILYVEGEPREEQLFLKRALNESLDFDLIQEWIPPRQWTRPTNLLKRYELREYDALILGDIPARALSTETQAAIADRISNGGGILFMGGYFSFDAGGYGNSRLSPVFPIRLSRNKRPQQLGSPVDRSLHIEGAVKLVPQGTHPITALENSEPANSRRWDRLKPMLGMNRFLKKNGPGIRTLLADKEGKPALVTGTFNRGRVLAFAADTTWQWALAGENQALQQFWRQCVLWLINRETLTEGFRLSLERRRLLIDETPNLSIEWFGGSDGDEMPDQVEIEISRDGKTIGRVPASKSSENFMSAKLSGLSKPGLYKASLKANGKGGRSYDADIAFVVRDESRELARPDADWQMMKNIVSANEVAGGRLFYPDELQQLIQLLRSRQEASKVTTIENRRLGDAAWDSWIFLVLFCVLMTVEWALRKSWQLP